MDLNKIKFDNSDRLTFTIPFKMIEAQELILQRHYLNIHLFPKNLGEILEEKNEKCEKAVVFENFLFICKFRDIFESISCWLLGRHFSYIWSFSSSLRAIHNTLKQIRRLLFIQSFEHLKTLTSYNKKVIPQQFKSSESNFQDPIRKYCAIKGSKFRNRN